MNEELKERMDELSYEIQKHHKRYRASFRNVVIFYIVVIIFVVFYITVLGFRLLDLTEPKTAAALISSKVQFRPEYSRELDPFAAEMARNTIRILPLSVQIAGNEIREKIGEAADPLSRKMEEKYALLIHDILERQTAGKKNFQAIPAEVSQELRKVDERAFQNYIGTNFTFSLPCLRKRMRDLRKTPAIDLSRRDYVERDLLLCYLFLLESERFRDTGIAPFFEMTSGIPYVLEEAARDALPVAQDQNRKN